mgnify:CR=1 FL=1
MKLNGPSKLRRGAVGILVEVELALVIGGDAGDGQPVSHLDIAGQRDRRGARLAPVSDVGFNLILLETRTIDCLGLGINAVVARVLVAGRGAQDELHAVARLEQDRPANAIFAGAGEIGLARQLVLEPAVGLRIGEGHTRSELVAQRHVDGTVQVDAVVIAIAGVEIAVDVVELRRAADQVDRAAGGVLAVEGALRAAQHLDALEIVHGDAEEGEVALVDFVIIGRDRARLIERIVRHRHPAQRENRGVVADDRGQLEVGHLGYQRIHRIDPRFGQRIPANRGNRDRDRLEVFRSLRRRHHDLARTGAIFIRVVLGMGRACREHGDNGEVG